jgi:hypothetical protein
MNLNQIDSEDLTASSNVCVLLKDVPKNSYTNSSKKMVSFNYSEGNQSLS